MLDVTSDTYLEFPYNGIDIEQETLKSAFKVVPSNWQDQLNAGTITDPADDDTPLVGEGRFTIEVLVNRSSHKPNGQGTTVYEVFQGNVGTFVRVDDVEELVSEDPFRLFADQPWNTFKQDRDMIRQIFKVIDGSVKDPELESGYNGTYGHFTGDDTIISFSEELAQTFLTDIEGRNTEDDKITRLKPPPTVDSYYDNKMSVTVDGTDSVTITGAGGIVESYATALDNKLNPENQPEE